MVYQEHFKMLQEYHTRTKTPGEGDHRPEPSLIIEQPGVAGSLLVCNATTMGTQVSCVQALNKRRTLYGGRG